MLFSPRHPPPLKARLQVALWPRRSFARSARYVHLRTLRLSGAPRHLALGVAIGVFVATLPVPGAQFLLAAALAWTFGGNVPAALLGTFWANPVTLPVLWLSSHWIGQKLVGGGLPFDLADVAAQLSRLGASLLTPGVETVSLAYATLAPVLKPLAAGAVVLGLATAGLAYLFSLHLLDQSRRKRQSHAWSVAQTDASELAAR